MGEYATGVRFRGINRAGAEFGVDWCGWETGHPINLPGTDAQLNKELDYYTGKGFNAIRFPIAWERVQPALNGPLEAGYLARIEKFIEAATKRGFLLIIDLHNYNRYATGAISATGAENPTFTETTYGAGLLNVSHLVDVWTKLANAFKGNSRVAFGIMNEPHDFIGEYNTWFDDLQRVVTAIRGTGATQLILVPNSRGSDVSHWFDVLAPITDCGTTIPNFAKISDSQAALTITDPVDNYAFDMHQYYWKDDGSKAADLYLKRIQAVTAWAKKPDEKHPEKQMKLFLSEFGVEEDIADGGKVIESILEHLNANNDVWIGWTPWNLEPYCLTKPGSNFTEDGHIEMAWYDVFLEPNIVNKP